MNGYSKSNAEYSPKKNYRNLTILNEYVELYVDFENASYDISEILDYLLIQRKLNVAVNYKFSSCELTNQTELLRGVGLDVNLFYVAGTEDQDML